MVDIGVFPSVSVTGSAADVSADESTLVGRVGTYGDRWKTTDWLRGSRRLHGPCRFLRWASRRGNSSRAASGAQLWTPERGLEDIGSFGGQGFGSSAGIGEAAPADGSVVVGQSRNTGEYWRAFRWTRVTGFRTWALTVPRNSVGARELKKTPSPARRSEGRGDLVEGEESRAAGGGLQGRTASKGKRASGGHRASGDRRGSTARPARMPPALRLHPRTSRT